MRSPISLTVALACTASAVLLAPLAPRSLAAQSNGSSGAITPQGAAKVDPDAKRVMGLADIGRWKRINAAALSANGAWMSYTYAPNEGDDTLFVKQLDAGTLYTVPVGSAPQFSDDSKWIAYLVSPSTGRGGRGGRGGGGGGGGRGRGGAPAADSGTAAARHLELLELATGQKYDVPQGQSFKFSKGSHWLAVRTSKANAAAKNNGSDLMLRELATGITRNIGNVNLYDFNDAGTLLAYTVDAADRVGNGVYLVDLATNASTVLNSAAADYDQLSWSDKGASLAALRGDVKKGNTYRDNTLLLWTGVGTSAPHATTYDPAADPAFPKGYVLSELAALRWSRDGSHVNTGIKEQEATKTPPAEPQANVDVWHWKDAELQSVQMVRFQQEQRATLAASYDVSANKLVALADTTMRNVTPTPDPRWAVGRIDTTYRGAVEWGGTKEDYYRVNTATGEKSLIAAGLTRTMGSSPDGRWFLYLKGGRVYAYDMNAGRSTELAADAKNLSFVNAQDDYPYEKPAYGVAGWSKDGKSVILDNRYDLYVVPLDGGKATNLTGGIGDAQQIVFRIVRLDRPAAGGGRGGSRGGAFGGAASDDDEGIDLAKPLLLSAYGDLTKKSGYYTLAPGGKPAPLVYDDASIGGAVKAQNADRVIFTRQTYKEAPDYYATTSSFASPKKVTDADPFIGEYRMASNKILVDFKNSRGVKLQGTLLLPADYQPGKKYPMIVYFYERLTNTMNQFAMPIFDDRPHFLEYASDGYLIFEPDIQYETGKPGTSALDCVTSGVKKVIEMGYADPKHIGLQGHSWGGYQTSFILTQTDMFATIVTGAPPTDLLSFYDELYKSSGTVQQGITEIGQVRMGEGVTPWTQPELYRSQSPIEHVQNIKTPFLILQGTSDGAVDWDQGLELYNAARRWGKTVVFLSYPGEDHHLTKKENQKDFQVRMKQWFDHYLKGTPAPKWMMDGVPQSKKGGAIE